MRAWAWARSPYAGRLNAAAWPARTAARGTGLGLAMDTRICLAHGDWILVTSQQGLGGWFGGGFTRHR